MSTDYNITANGDCMSSYGINSNGKDLADTLMEEVDHYNRDNSASGEKATIQVYDAGKNNELQSDSEADFMLNKSKKQQFPIPPTYYCILWLV